MAQRAQVQMQRLEELELEFKRLLLSCLERCARGRWGLFRQNYSDSEDKYLRWPEADRLLEMANEIQALEVEFGQRDSLCARYFYYCSLRGSNDLGEPKRARAFLNEIDSL